MRRNAGWVALAAWLTLVCAAPAVAQTPITIKTDSPGDPLELISPAPGSRDVSRPREADYYPADNVRVRHDPGFVEPLTARPASGPIKKVGVSGWTAPPGRGDGSAQFENSGWFGFGISFTWE